MPALSWARIILSRKHGRFHRRLHHRKQELCPAALPSPRRNFGTVNTKMNAATLAKAFPERGYTAVPKERLIEEECLIDYSAEKFYPVQLGEVLDSRFQILAKLGFGTVSTVWLCRNTKNDRLQTIKVCVASSSATSICNEVMISQHLSSIDTDHPGKALIRLVKDEFHVIGPSKTSHQCLVFDPLGTTYTNFRNMFSDRALSKVMLQQSLNMILLALDFLHQAGVVHTDISPNNILLSSRDSAVYAEIEKSESERPSARKVLADRTIYRSHQMPLTNGPLFICDFGAARLGPKHRGDVMPGPYRAPEVILGMEWDCKIDIWSVGVMIWDLYEGERLFNAERNGSLNDEQHLAEMVALLGPPPKEFISRSEKCLTYWDSDGNWIASTEIPNQSFEKREHRSSAIDRELLLKLVRKMLRWMPEERPTAEELFEDEFLVQHMVGPEGITRAS